MICVAVAPLSHLFGALEVEGGISKLNVQKQETGTSG